MSKVLTRISIPARLMDEMLLKESAAFDLPSNADGIAFMQQWQNMSSDKRDELMKTAYQRNISILDAKKLLEKSLDEII